MIASTSFRPAKAGIPLLRSTTPDGGETLAFAGLTEEVPA